MLISEVVGKALWRHHKAQAAADTQADKTQTAHEAKTAVKAPALQQTQSGRAELTAVWCLTPSVLTLQCGVDQRSCQCSSTRELALYVLKFA